MFSGKRAVTIISVLSVLFLFGAFSFAGGPAPVKAHGKAAAPAKIAKGNDTLIVLARLTEIPGPFPSNDLYNYVYIMKYRVIKVLKGHYAKQEILVGHYNPLIPRSRLQGSMRALARGNVGKFETGARQKLTLITPIDRVWKDEVEDNYPDADLEKYYALEADVAR